MNVFSYDVLKANNSVQTLSEYKGKVLLIVNTASKCQFTPQFDDLQKLYDQYKEQGLEILGFPCNQFGEQEPGTNEEAASFCQLNYGVTFPVFSKVEVNGAHEHPLFQYLKREAPFRGFDDSDISAKLLKMMLNEKYPQWAVGNEIKWNFTKFLVDSDGHVIKRYEPSVEPANIAPAIEDLLSRS